MAAGDYRDPEVLMRDAGALFLIILAAGWIGYSSANHLEVPPLLTLLAGAAAGYLFNGRSDNSMQLMIQRDAYKVLADRAATAIEQAGNQHLFGAVPLPPSVPVVQSAKDQTDLTAMSERVTAAIHTVNTTGLAPPESPRKDPYR